MDKVTRVRVLGREYTLRVREEDEALTRKLASYIDTKMQAFQRAHPDQPEITAAVITSLVIAEELHTVRELRAPSGSILDDELDAMTRRLGVLLSSDETGQTEP